MTIGIPAEDSLQLAQTVAIILGLIGTAIGFLLEHRRHKKEFEEHKKERSEELARHKDDLEDSLKRHKDELEATLKRHERELGFATYLQSTLAYAELEKMVMRDKDLLDIYWSHELSQVKEEKRDDLIKDLKIYQWYYQFFTILEVAFYAQHNKLFDSGQWEGWESTVKNQLENDEEHIRTAWKDSEKNYSSAFRRRINSLMKE